MEEFPSGQRGQTVNLLSSTSVVRIHPPPPRRSKVRFAPTLFYALHEKASSARFLAPPLQTATAYAGLRFGGRPADGFPFPVTPLGVAVFLLRGWIRKPALSGAPVARRNRRAFSAEKRIHPPPPRRSKLYIVCSDFFQKSERTHTAAPPFQTGPTSLGSGLAAALRAAFHLR